jgi:hypothetical protein
VLPDRRSDLQFLSKQFSSRLYRRLRRLLRYLFHFEFFLSASASPSPHPHLRGCAPLNPYPMPVYRTTASQGAAGHGVLRAAGSFMGLAHLLNKLYGV